MGELTVRRIDTVLGQVENARELPGITEVLDGAREEPEKVSAVIKCLDTLIRQGRFLAPVADTRGQNAQIAIKVKRRLGI